MHVSGAESLTLIHVDDQSFFLASELQITMLGCKEVSSNTSCWEGASWPYHWHKEIIPSTYNFSLQGRAVDLGLSGIHRIVGQPEPDRICWHALHLELPKVVEQGRVTDESGGGKRFGRLKSDRRAHGSVISAAKQICKSADPYACVAAACK